MNPARAEYMDISITPVVAEELEDLEIYSASESAKAAVSKVRRQQALSAVHAAS